MVLFQRALVAGPIWTAAAERSAAAALAVRGALWLNRNQDCFLESDFVGLPLPCYLSESRTADKILIQEFHRRGAKDAERKKMFRRLSLPFSALQWSKSFASGDEIPGARTILSTILSP
jgi:hypothetical protein